MKKVFILVILMIIISCASLVPDTRRKMMKKGISIEQDTFNHETITTLNLPTNDFSDMSEITLGFKYYKGKTNKLVMFSYIYRTDWMLIERIEIQADSNSSSFSSVNRNREDLYNGYIQEYDEYDITLKYLKELSEANSITYHIKGSEYYLEQTLKQSHIKLLKEYYNTITQ